MAISLDTCLEALGEAGRSGSRGAGCHGHGRHRQTRPRVLYRHPEPIFRAEAPYEIEGPVGNVVFGTGPVELNGRFWLSYGAGDGVIGAAWAGRDALLEIVRRGIKG